MIELKVITAAIITSLVALYQIFIAREKLRLDLYNRRFNVYSNAIRLLQVTETLEANQPRSEKFNEAFKEFIISSREGKFLFDEDVFEVLQKISNTAFAIAGYKEHCTELNTSIHPSLHFYDESIARQKSLYESVALLERQIEKYLSFHKLDVLSHVLNIIKNFRKDKSNN